MITDYKITEIFCATDEFSKKFDEEIENMPLLGSGGKSRSITSRNSQKNGLHLKEIKPDLKSFLECRSERRGLPCTLSCISTVQS